jgi:8-amino-7-oxononanoate synthase
MPTPPRIQAQLQELKSRSLFRQLRQLNSAQGPAMVWEGRELDNFSSNDYLALANEPFLKEAAKAAIDQFGVGSGASRLVCGSLSPHRLLEERLAEFKGTEAALSFSSGYAAAVGTLGALLGAGDVAILDKLAHASLIDGARLSGATIRVFPHNDLDKLGRHLEWAWEKHPEARVLVITESVFSMDGDRAPLKGIADLKDQFGAMLLLDEAHAVGVLGSHGRGLADEIGIANRVDVQMGTLSKALGASGGYICGSRELVDLLINKARSFIYSTAPSPAIAAAAAAAVEHLMRKEGELRREKLWANIDLFSKLACPREAKRPLSAIIPVVVGDEESALAASQRLLDQGLLVPAIRYPTVARGTARLRITLSAAHSAEQIGKLAEALRDVVGESAAPS